MYQFSVISNSTQVIHLEKWKWQKKKVKESSNKDLSKRKKEKKKKKKLAVPRHRLFYLRVYLCLIDGCDFF